MPGQDDALLAWLLKAQTPSIRYLTLRNLWGQPETSEDVQAARTDMRQSGPIPIVLNGQSESGSWMGERNYYSPKYTSTHWRMLLLAELHADPFSQQLQAGAEHMLNETEMEARDIVVQGKHGLECFWGNLLRYQIHAGKMIEVDARITNLLNILSENAPHAGWRCAYNDERPCAWGAARTLWGLAAVPDKFRTAQIENAIRRGISFLLEEHDLVRANYPTPEKGKVHPLWWRLNFPLFYQVDILFVLRVLKELRALDHHGAQSALEWLRNRQGVNGRWRGSSPYRSRTFGELCTKAETDRWITLHALMVLEGK